MKCGKCAANMVESTTTDVTECGNCLVVVRNVPCYKCTECGEIFYTLKVAEQLEKIVDSMKSVPSEISIVAFNQKAA